MKSTSSIKKPNNVWSLLDILMLLLSPLAILMFVVGVIVVLDCTGMHQAFLRRFEQDNVLTQAVIDQIDANWIVVRFTDPNQKEPRIGLVKPVYYPSEVIRALKPGDTVNLRYLAAAYESEAVLADDYAAVQNYRGYLWEPGILLLISWVAIVRYPDFLSLDDAFVGMIFVGLGLFVLVFGVVADGLLPRVNEHSFLVTQLLVILNAVFRGAEAALPPAVWVLVLALPAVVMVYLVWNARPLAPLLKALVYLWYLASLLVFSFQNGAAVFFSTPELALTDAFVFGTTFIFLLLRGLFAIRFFLIASSILLPRNRPLVRQVMPLLFADEQVKPLRFVLFALVIAILVALNAWLNWLPRAVLFNLAVITSVQVFFNPRR